jgi:photosystem II stability/assembly factor-like uncharacterized protein
MRIYALVFVGFLVPTWSFAAVPNPADAALHAVQFVDKAEGWTVGDEGTILHTIDGGKTWERQPSGTKASLRAISMLSPYVGFAVGREESPYFPDAQGIILTTTDSGATWKEIPTPGLPGLNAIRFVNEATGYACGDTTDVDTTGAFETSDGGKTWQALKGSRGLGWKGIHATSAERVLLLGDTAPAIVKSHVIVRPTVLQSFRFGGTCAVEHDGETLVLDRSGQVVKLKADGSTHLSQIPAARAGFQVSGISGVGPKLTCVGLPGSVVLQSPDFGQTWTTSQTPCQTKLRAVQMLDANLGWAVGDFNTILHTTDGGKTWTTQRTGGQQAAILLITSRGDSLPLGLVAQYACEGYHAATLCFRPMREERLHAAFRKAGGRVAECDPLQNLADVMLESAWNAGPYIEPQQWAMRENPEHTRTQAILKRMVLAIRLYRPNTLISQASEKKSDLAERELEHLLPKAITLAADAKEYPAMLAELNLQPHKVEKHQALISPSSEAGIRDFSAIEPKIGEAIKDIVASAQMILTGTPVMPDMVGLKTLMSHGNTPIAEGGPARAKAMPHIASTDPAKVAVAKRDHEKRREFERLAQVKPADFAKLTALLNEMPLEWQPQMALVAGGHLTRGGQWTLAREMYAFVAEKHGVQPEAITARAWLARTMASSELRRRMELGHFPIVQTSLWQTADEIQQAGVDELTSRVKYRFVNTQAEREWDRATLSHEVPLAAFGFQHVLRPEVQLPLIATRRRMGLQAEAIKSLQALIAANPADAKSDNRLGRWVEELRLLTNDGPDTVYAPRTQCMPTATKPHLDGKLDEACWREAEMLPIHPPGNFNIGIVAKAKFCSDDKFLYIGIESQDNRLVTNKQTPPKPEKREHDMDLSGQDRVEILLDLDRDYSTYYRLCVDSRGCVAEDCCGDASWNPKWFVAVEPHENGWTAEIAIPLSELTGSTKLAGQTWGMNVTRIMPGVATASWAGAASVKPNPAMMGQLRFVTQTAKPAP